MSEAFNKGKVWYDKNITKLLDDIKDKKSREMIAKEHGRTIGGISSKLKGIAADYYFNKKPTDEIFDPIKLGILDGEYYKYNKKTGKPTIKQIRQGQVWQVLRDNGNFSFIYTKEKKREILRMEKSTNIYQSKMCLMKGLRFTFKED
jgi:hypothetical protein